MSDAKPNSGTEQPRILIQDLIMDYPDGSGVISVLTGVDLTVSGGDMVAVMGPSGSGKSTLLHILGLFLRPTKGIYLLDSIDVLGLSRFDQATIRGRHLGFVSQSCDLLEKSTVYENLELPLIYNKVDFSQREEHIASALDKVGLTHRIRHAANRLSGGEQQRVAVARALVNSPGLILADEPTGQLDRDNSHQVMELFHRIVEDKETALVMVTHDPEIAAHCGRVYGLVAGRLEAMDPDQPGGAASGAQRLVC